MIFRSILGNKFLKQFILFLSKVFCFFPRKLSLVLGSLFARFIYIIYLLSPFRKHLSNNIRLTLPVSDKIAKEIAKKHIIKLTKNIIDFLRFEKINSANLDRIVSFKNQEYFIEAQREGRGIIFISSHSGCWELLGASLALRFLTTFNVLAQRPANPVFDELFCYFREKVGVKTYYNDKGVQGLRPIFRALDNKECVGFLIDQHGESEDTFGEFFGKIVSIPSGPVLFAMKTKAPIVPVFINRKKKDNHEITFYPPIYTQEGDKEAEVHRVSQILYNTIERNIKENPDEWLWIYERWNKLSPYAYELAVHMKRFRLRRFQYIE